MPVARHLPDRTDVAADIAERIELASGPDVEIVGGLPPGKRLDQKPPRARRGAMPMQPLDRAGESLFILRAIHLDDRLADGPGRCSLQHAGDGRQRRFVAQQKHPWRLGDRPAARTQQTRHIARAARRSPTPGRSLGGRMEHEVDVHLAPRQIDMADGIDAHQQGIGPGGKAQRTTCRQHRPHGRQVCWPILRGQEQANVKLIQRQVFQVRNGEGDPLHRRRQAARGRDADLAEERRNAMGLSVALPVQIHVFCQILADMIHEDQLHVAEADGVDPCCLNEKRLTVPPRLEAAQGDLHPPGTCLRSRDVFRMIRCEAEHGSGGARMDKPGLRVQHGRL